MTVKKGHVIPWLLPDICSDDKADDLLRRILLGALHVGLAAENSLLQVDSLPPSLRPHQVQAVADLQDARKRNVKCGVANKATGSGKVCLLFKHLIYI